MNLFFRFYHLILLHLTPFLGQDWLIEWRDFPARFSAWRVHSLGVGLISFALIRWLLSGDGTRLSPAHRATHTYVIGQPGTGKSKALESWVLQDLASGYGVGLVDPHGSFFGNIMNRLAADPEIWERVVVIDPTNPKWTVCFNPLEAFAGLSHERLALFLTDVVIKIWKLDATSAPRMVWLLSNTFVALSYLGLTLLDLPRFLLDSSFRESLLPQLAHEGARAYFEFEFPQGQAAVNQWVAPVLNKMGTLIFDPDIRLMFGGKSTINFRQIIDQKLILLVNIPKGVIGEAASALLGAFIVAHLQKAALSRVEVRQPIPFYLYLDEFQNYTTDNIKDILSESRKYALSLTLAHQYLDQLSQDLRSAVLNTAGTLACFRVGYHDAYELVREIFPGPDFIKTTERQLKLQRVGSIPLPLIEESQKGLGWEGLAQILTRLPQREFWARKRMSGVPVHIKTFENPDLVPTPELKQALEELLQCSGQRFGRLKEEIQQELAKTQVPSKDSGQSPGVGEIPIWGK